MNYVKLQISSIHVKPFILTHSLCFLMFLFDDITRSRL